MVPLTDIGNREEELFEARVGSVGFRSFECCSCNVEV